MKKVSISFKMFLAFLGFILFILFLGWLFITFFLQDYYEYKKVETVKEYATQIQTSISQENLQDFKDKIDFISEKVGGSILIVDSNRNIEYVAGALGGIGRIRKIVASVNLNNDYDEKVYKTGFKQNNLLSLVYVKRISEYGWIIFEIPFHSIEETVQIMQGFFGYIILIAIVISAILAFLFSKTVTKPLIRLNTIAKEIQKLNFSVKYKEKRNDEIGHLGNTFNMITEKLEDTISRLKSELEKEKNLDSLRKQFVAQVSHELQTPISVIKGYAEGLSDGIVDSEEEEEYYYAVIQNEANKMSKMIRELLDLSQLESGTFKIRKKTFDIINLLKVITDKYSKICEEKSISIKFITDLSEAEVIGDEMRIEQVISNFINNAINHVDEKKYIEVSAVFKKDSIDVSVYNSGKHIAKEDIQYIWESFYKVKDSKEGTGLGLAISKSILQLHKSNYYIKNVEGGVKFGFEFKKS